MGKLMLFGYNQNKNIEEKNEKLPIFIDFFTLFCSL
jgi:hypothetical protein